MKEHDHTEEGRDVRKILTALVVSRRALGRIAPLWDGRGFSAQWVNSLAGWCVDYYRKYRKAPRKNVETILAEEGMALAQEERELVETFLSALGGDYDSKSHECNPDYAADLAIKHFRAVRQKRFLGDLSLAVRGGEPERADEIIDAYRRTASGEGTEVDFFHDDAALEDALDPERVERLIEFPGPIGEFFGPAFGRNCFVAFFGKEGLGKSWVLQEVTWQALLCRRKVAYFGIGDMTLDQVMRRFLVRTAEHPLRAREVRVPISLTPTGFTSSRVEFETRAYDKRLGAKRAKTERDRVLAERLRTKGSPLKICCFASGTLSVDRVESMLDQWEGNDWVPDVLVIDYADIMALPAGYKVEQREKINQLWMDLRRVSGQKHNLIVTASQVNRVSYKVKLLGMEHVSEEKRKLAHVTSCFGMNQTGDEKADGVMRFNYLKFRDDEFDPKRCCWVAGNPSLGNPIMLSAYPTRDELTSKSETESDE